MTTEETRFDHVGVSVADLERATEWYCRALRLSVEGQFAVPGTNLRGIMLKHASGYRIELLHRPDSVPGLRPETPLEAAGTKGYGHICLCVPDVDAAYADLTGAGGAVRMPPAPSPRKGARFAWVADPDGNLIELLDRKD